MAPAIWEGRKVLVTGGSGFAGKRLVAALAEQGARVTVLARHIPDPDGRSIRWARVAVEDVAAVGRLVQECQPDTVFHLAALALVGAALTDPSAAFDANIRGTWVVLEACRRQAPLASFILTSSAAVYGDQHGNVSDESQLLAGRNPYTASKICAEILAQSYAATYGMLIGIARPSNLYGPGDLNFSRIIPGTIRAAIRGESPVILSDGSPRRDYLYVDDLISGLLALASYVGESSITGRVFNFASGESLSVLDLTQRILSTTGREDLKPQILNQSSLGANQECLSIWAARNDLDWQPQSPISERLRQTVEWYRNYFCTS